MRLVYSCHSCIVEGILLNIICTIIIIMVHSKYSIDKKRKNLAYLQGTWTSFLRNRLWGKLSTSRLHSSLSIGCFDQSACCMLELCDCMHNFVLLTLTRISNRESNYWQDAWKSIQCIWYVCCCYMVKRPFTLWKPCRNTWCCLFLEYTAGVHLMLATNTPPPPPPLHVWTAV